MITAYKPIHINSSLLVMREYDPTRTITLRNRFAQTIRRRFDELARSIRTAIVDRDVFGLQEVTTQRLPGQGAFDFPRSDEKVQAFMRWLREEMDTTVLEIRQMQRVGGSINQAWTNVYIKDAYQKGVKRGRKEMKMAGFDIPGMDETGGIRESLRAPFHADRLGVLYTRTFNDLKGITDAMDSLISRVLTTGIADGDNPRLLAKKLDAVIRGGGGNLDLIDDIGRFIPGKRRAEMLARTEIIRAHHQATVQEYRNWGAEGVRVKAEWSTAGDNRVCPECASLEGDVYGLDEIRNKIPLHPQCRCIALPLNVNDPRQAESARQTRIERDRMLNG